MLNRNRSIRSAVSKEVPMTVMPKEVVWIVPFLPLVAALKHAFPGA
jgi:hypothetical protein